MKCPVELKAGLHPNQILLVWDHSFYIEQTAYEENIILNDRYL